MLGQLRRALLENHFERAKKKKYEQIELLWRGVQCQHKKVSWSDAGPEPQPLLEKMGWAFCSVLLELVADPKVLACWIPETNS